MTRLPESYLAPKSQPWGRVIEKSITDAQQDIALNARNTDINLKQLNSSVNLLGRQQTILASQQATLAAQQDALAAQQTYLNGLKTYTSSNGSIYSVYTVNTTVNIASISNTFTLDRTSTILINFSAWSNLSVNGYGGAQGYLWGSVSGIPGGISSGYSGGAVLIDGYSNIVRPQFIATSNGIQSATLPAGTYTVTITWRAIMYATWNASCQLTDQRLTISVIS